MLKKAANMFGRMEIAEYIYGGVVEYSYKNLPGQMPNVLVTVEIREENPTSLRLTPQWMRALVIAENDV